MIQPSEAELFSELCKLAKRKQARNYYDVGCWLIDTNQSLGGKAIEEITTAKGGRVRVSPRVPDKDFPLMLSGWIGLLKNMESAKRRDEECCICHCHHGARHSGRHYRAHDNNQSGIQQHGQK